MLLLDIHIESVIILAQGMDLDFDLSLAAAYTSKRQRNRVLTEAWMAQNAYCPSCGESVSQHIPNKPVADFYCPRCSEDYELKSKVGVYTNTAIDGAYHTMIQRINSDTAPSFFFLSHNEKRVHSLFVTPACFLSDSVIIKRKPTKVKGRTNLWIGCSIDLRGIPESGRIYYVRNGEVCSRQEVVDHYAASAFLRTTEIKAGLRGWLLDVLCCIERLKRKTFSLADVYRFENYLSAKHPHNRNVRAKIRQQLQLLRDMGYLRFTGRGNYELMS